jgi:hypothetical protein
MGVAMGCACASAQTASPPAAPAADVTLTDTLVLLQQATQQMNDSLESTHPQRWKVKPDEHDADVRNYLSIHHDLEDVLPGLLKDAQASPRSASAGIAVYRNVNALYDVLVRLQQTAALTGKEDAPALQDALTRLETVRGLLAQKLIDMAAQQETNLVRAQQQIAQLIAAEPPKRIVADDNAPAKKTVRSSKTVGGKPVGNTAAGSKPAGAKPAGAKPAGAAAAGKAATATPASQ